MTKDEIVYMVRKGKCKMLDKHDIESYSKEDIIKHLKKSLCPILQKLME